MIVDQTIEKVSFCAPDRNHEKGFAYICRDGTTRRWMCHGFMAVKESVSVSIPFISLFSPLGVVLASGLQCRVLCWDVALVCFALSLVCWVICLWWTFSDGMLNIKQKVCDCCMLKFRWLNKLFWLQQRWDVRDKIKQQRKRKKKRKSWWHTLNLWTSLEDKMSFVWLH